MSDSGENAAPAADVSATLSLVQSGDVNETVKDELARLAVLDAAVQHYCREFERLAALCHAQEHQLLERARTQKDSLEFFKLQAENVFVCNQRNAAYDLFLRARTEWLPFLARIGTKKLFVKTLTGKVVDLRVRHDETVYLVKIQLSAHEGATPIQQRLMYAGHQLEDGNTTEYIEKESTLHLVLRLRGC